MTVGTTDHSSGNTGTATLERDPLVTGGKTFADVNDDISKPLESFPTKKWYIAFAVALSALVGGFSCIGWVIANGLGNLGLQSAVGWGVFIVNFVFWIGIGHA